MALRPVDISGGQVSGVDDLSPAASYVSNWEIDESGINRPRPRSFDLSITNLSSATTPIVGHSYWPAPIAGGHMVAVNEDGQVYTMSDAVPGFAQLRSTSAEATLVAMRAGARVTFVHGNDDVYMCGGTASAGSGAIYRWSPSRGLVGTANGGSSETTHIATLGQRIIYNAPLGDPSLFGWSGLGEGNWNSYLPTDISTADVRPDPVRGVYDNGTNLFIFGSETTQVYAVGTDPITPFELVNSINIGTSAGYSPVRLDSSFAFLDHHRRVAITDGNSVEPIGDAIQKTISDLDVVHDAFMWREQRGQHSLLGLRFPTEGRTFLYNMKGKHWTEQNEYRSDGSNYGFAVNSYAYWPKFNQHTFSRVVNGGIFQRLHATSGSPLVCERITGWQDFGSLNRKRSTRVRTVFRRGTTAEGGTPGALELRVQNQDGPWSPWKQLSIGESSDYDQTRDAFFGGIFKRRRYHVRFTTSENMSLVGLYDDLDELAA